MQMQSLPVEHSFESLLRPESYRYTAGGHREREVVSRRNRCAAGNKVGCSDHIYPGGG
eukprot:COSAG01_NODE_8064_length_2934_cov_3.017989_1_plen_57_part_10